MREMESGLPSVRPLNVAKEELSDRQDMAGSRWPRTAASWMRDA